MFFFGCQLTCPGRFALQSATATRKGLFPSRLTYIQPELSAKEEFASGSTFVKPIKIFTIIGQNNDGENLLAV